MRGKEDFTVKFEIKETLAVLNVAHSGWQKELNLISWGGMSPKLDIRDWAPEHERMGKGATLTPAQADMVRAALDKYFKEHPLSES